MILPSSEIEKAAELLKNGKLVAFPTETVYGLAASVFSPDAIQKIFQVKGRPSDNPLIVHISHLKQLDLIVENVPPSFDLLAKAFFPGPLTIILPKQSCVPAIVSANLPTIGVRMPAHPIAQKLIDAVGVPLAAPSANLSGRPSSTTAQHVLDDFGEKISAVLDGGECQYGLESTVLILVPQPTILRPGAISKEEIEEVLQTSVSVASEEVDKPLSPGMKHRHYAPKASVVLFESKLEIDNYVREEPSLKRLILSFIQPEKFYSLLRDADSKGYEEILILCDHEMKKNDALMNRMKRASLDGVI